MRAAASGSGTTAFHASRSFAFLSRTRREHGGEDAGLEVHEVLLALDPGHLHVERDELVDVPGRVVLLRAVGGTDLEDPLEARGDHRLLVQLRRLGQVHLPVEVVHREEARAALGARADELRGLDLGEPLGAQVVGERREDRALHSEDRKDLRVAQRDHAVVEDRLEGELVRLLVHRHGQVGRGRGDHLNRLRLQLDAARGLRVGDHRARGPDHALERDARVRLEHDLRRARAVAHEHEADLPEVTHPVHPSAEGGLGSDVSRKLGCKRPHSSAHGWPRR